MADSTERLLVRIDATTEQLRRELAKADQAVKATQSGISQTMAKIDKSFESLKRQFSGLGAAISGIGIGLAMREIIQASDKMAGLRGQLGLVTNSQEELNAVYARALKLANETGQATESTVNLYARLARSTEELGLSQDELFTITKAINQSFVVSGASATEASAAILQLSQGMASGVLRGEELNSVMENSPRLARALADGLGVTIGQLRAMGKEGELTAEKVTTALMQTADTINDEFQTMPMTIGRVWQTMSNDIDNALGSVDASPLINSVEELRSVISDPNFQASIVALSQALLDVVAASASALSGLVQFTKFVSEEMARQIGGAAADDLAGLTAEYDALADKIKRFGSLVGDNKLAEWNSELADLYQKIEQANPATSDLAVNVAKVAKSTEAAVKPTVQLAKATETTSKGASKYVKELASINKETDKIKARHEKANKAITEGVEALDDMVKATDQYIAGLEFELSLVGKTAKEQAILTAQREHGATATDEQRAAITRLTGQLYEAQAATEAAANAQKPFQDALQGTIERIDEAFAGAWKGAFDSFQDFADGIKTSFQNLIGELLHIAITRPIVMQIGAALGLGGASGAASAGGSSILGGASSLLPSGASSFFTRPYTNTTLGTAVPGDGGAALPGSFNYMNAGAALGGGLVGGYLGNQVYGQTSGLGQAAGGFGGAALGATYGAALGPFGIALGAALGTFGGGFVESLFGGSNNGNNSARGTLNLATGSSEVWGVGKSFNQENVDALNELVPIIQEISDALGGSNAVLNIRSGDNSGLSLNGQSYKNQEDFIAATIRAIVDGSSTLSRTLKNLIKGFDGSSDELIQFAESMVSIDNILQNNPVSKAIDDFAKNQEINGRTLRQTYDGQIKAILDLSYNFDGSAEAAKTLNEALSINAQLAYDMATALQSIGESTRSVVAEQVDYFGAQTRTPDENLQYMEGQLRFIDAILPLLTDPNQILAARDMALDLNKSIFDAGPDDLQRANVQTFIDMANNIGAKTATAIENATSSLATTQADMNAQLGAVLEMAASGFQAPADTMMSAAQLMYLAVQNFIGNGGQYNQVVA